MSTFAVMVEPKQCKITAQHSPNNLTLPFPEDDFNAECTSQEVLSAEQKAAKTLPRKGASILSPLRYPGAKRRFASYVAETLKLNGIKPKLFVEPFAGGASVALQLLNDGLVETVGLGEIDPLVASFWDCVFYDTEWLIRAVEREPIT